MIKRNLCLFFLVCVGVLSGQELNIKQYTVHDGLKQMQVNGVHQDSIGNLWVSTRGGLSRFNGAEFDNFEDVPCIPDYVIQTTQDSKGNIWILSGSKLIKFNGNECEEFPYPEGFKPDQFATIYEYSPGMFFILDATYGYYEWVFKEGDFFKTEAVFEEIGDDGVRSMARDGEWIYILTDHQELLIYNEYQFVKRVSVKNDARIATNKTDGSFSSFPNLLIKEPQTQWTVRYRIDINNSFQLIKNCAYNRKTGKHIYEENSLLHNHYSITDQLELNNTPLNQLITIDNVKNKWNILWRITEIDDVKYLETDRGLGMINNESFFQIPEVDLPYVWAVIENNVGELLFGGFDAGIKKQNGEEFIEFNKIDSECSIDHHTTHNLGQIYFGASILNKKIYFPSGKGILKEANNGFKLIKANCKEGVKDASLYTYPDTIRNVLIDCACQGVNIWDVDNELLLKKISKDSLQHKSCVLTAIIDQQGDYWFGYRPHIARYNPESETIKIYDNNHDDVMNTYVSSTMDTDGQLWFGGRKGMVYYDADLDSLMRFPLFEDQMVSALYSYSEDKLFASLENGIAMINIKKYKESGELQYQLFNQYNGYMGIEPNQNGLYLDSKDRLWITSATHLSYTYPKLLNYADYKLSPNIVSVNGDRINYHKDIIEIESGKNDVNVNYEAIGIKRPNEIIYSYRLDQEDWSEWTTNTTALINGISSGRHTIKLKIKTDNQDDFPIAQSSFSIDIPFYKEPHFGRNMSFLSLLAVSLTLIMVYRNQNLKKEKELLELSTQNLGFANRKLSQQLVILSKKEEQIQTPLEQSPEETVPEELVLKIPYKGKDLSIPLYNIVYVQSDRNYIDIYVEGQGRPITYRASLKGFMEAWLPKESFLRIHKRNIVNRSFIKKHDQKSVTLLLNDQLLTLDVGTTYLNQIDPS